MLVLSRKRGQVIWIGETMVKVHRIHGGTVSLAIAAPQEIKVLRGELIPGDQGISREINGNSKGNQEAA